VQRRRCPIEQPITLPPLDQAAAAWIEQEAKRTGVGIEEIARRLVYRGLASAASDAPPQRYHDLDHLAGTWSPEEAEEFRRASADFEQVDPSLWQ
jgi:hypothetical protein